MITKYFQSHTAFHRLASQILVLLWLILLGFLLWQHARKAHVPPIYDGLVYFQKGKNVWQHLRRKNFVNPLNVEPAYRPPGTVLMSFPFGYTEDFHGFHLRSVLIPVISFVFAVFLAGYSSNVPRARHWLLAVMAIFFSALPFFYHFEYTDYSLHDWAVPVYYWGLVDAFLGGVSALAAAAAVRGIQGMSPKWFTAAFLLASLCLLIKPAGMLTMAIVAFTWAIAALLRWLRPNAASKAEIRRRILWAGGILILIYGITLIACFKSAYLSPFNLEYGRGALRIIRTEFRMPITIFLLRDFLSCSLGYPLLIGAGLLGIAAVFGYRDVRLRTLLNGTPALVLVASAAIALAAGLWFWLHEAVITQVRFFMPLAMMAIVFATPLALALMVRFRALAGVLVVIFGVPALNLGLLLSHSVPSPRWQALTGVYVSTACCDKEVEQARELVAESRKAGKTPRVYAFDNSGKVFSFLSVGYYNSIVKPEAPSFTIQFPVSWERATVIRITDLMNSDYLLITPLDEAARRNILGKKTVSDFRDETLLFQATLAEASESSGVQKISESSLRLLKVTDRAKLRKALASLHRRHDWREVFVKANQDACLVPQATSASTSAQCTVPQ